MARPDVARGKHWSDITVAACDSGVEESRSRCSSEGLAGRRREKPHVVGLQSLSLKILLMQQLLFFSAAYVAGTVACTSVAAVQCPCKGQNIVVGPP